jgi:hypothetical protein
VVDGDESSGFVIESLSYHHQRFPGNCQLEFERCRILYNLLALLVRSRAKQAQSHACGTS